MSGSVSVFCALYTKYHRVVKTNKEKTTGFRCFSSCEHNPCELTKILLLNHINLFASSTYKHVQGRRLKSLTSCTYMDMFMPSFPIVLLHLDKFFFLYLNLNPWDIFNHKWWNKTRTNKKITMLAIFTNFTNMYITFGSLICGHVVWQTIKTFPWESFKESITEVCALNSDEV